MNNNNTIKRIILNYYIKQQKQQHYRFYCNININKEYYIKENGDNNKKIIKIGDKSEFIKTFTEKDVQLFSELIGDINPIHLNEEYTKKNNNKLFGGKCIIHGSLVSSLISTTVSNYLPGSIYLKQEINYLKPTFINDTIKAETTITNISGKKIYFNTKCISNNNEIVIEGPAIVYHPNLFSNKK